MLLPSAFSCEPFGAHQLPKTQRPKLPSFAPFEVSSSPRPGPAGLFASCRALHSILGGPVQPVQQAQPSCLNTTTIRPARQTNPFDQRKRLQSPPRLVAQPRGMNKRRREEFEEDLNTTTPTSGSGDSSDSERESVPTERNAYQTPKRQRRQPVNIPAGLAASDFDSLNTPNITYRAPRQRRRTTTNPDSQILTLSIPSPSQPHTLQPAPSIPTQTSQDSQPEDLSCWSPEDDRRLIEAVLSKLNLSSRDWNDCARQLGKDRDSLGRRWKMLVGEGNVGLRRGSGRMERTGLDVESW